MPKTTLADVHGVVEQWFADNQTELPERFRNPHWLLQLHLEDEAEQKRWTTRLQERCLWLVFTGAPTAVGIGKVLMDWWTS